MHGATMRICTVCSRISYRIFPLTNLIKYLHHDTSEIEVNVNLSVMAVVKKSKKKNHSDLT